MTDQELKAIIYPTCHHHQATSASELRHRVSNVCISIDCSSLTGISSRKIPVRCNRSSPWWEILDDDTIDSSQLLHHFHCPLQPDNIFYISRNDN